MNPCTIDARESEFKIQGLTPYNYSITIREDHAEV